MSTLYASLGQSLLSDIMSRGQSSKQRNVISGIDMSNDNNLLSSFYKQIRGLAFNGALSNEYLSDAAIVAKALGQQYGISPDLIDLLVYGIKDIRHTDDFYLKCSINDEPYIFSMLMSSDTGLSFSPSITWNEVNIPGRAEPFFVYSHSEATPLEIKGNILLDCASGVTPEDTYKNKQVAVGRYKTNLALLRAFKYPVVSGAGIGSPPIWDVTIISPHSQSMLFRGKVRMTNANWKLAAPYIDFEGSTYSQNVEVSLSLKLVEMFQIKPSNSQTDYNQLDLVKDFESASQYFKDYKSSIPAIGNQASSIIQEITNGLT